MAKKKGSTPKLKSVRYSLPQEGQRLDATLSIRLPEELKDRLQDFCESKGLKTNTVMNHIVKEFLKTQGV